MIDIQSLTIENMQRKKPQLQNIMCCPIWWP